MAAMTSVATASRALRLVRTVPLGRRSFMSSSTDPAVGHSTKKLYGVAAVSAAVGIDVTWAYFTFVKKPAQPNPNQSA